VTQLYLTTYNIPSFTHTTGLTHFPHHTICTRNVEILSTGSPANQAINFPVISDDSQIASGTHSSTPSLGTGDFFILRGGVGGFIKWQQCEIDSP